MRCYALLLPCLSTHLFWFIIPLFCFLQLLQHRHILSSRHPTHVAPSKRGVRGRQAEHVRGDWQQAEACEGRQQSEHTCRCCRSCAVHSWQWEVYSGERGWVNATLRYCFPVLTPVWLTSSWLPQLLRCRCQTRTQCGIPVCPRFSAGVRPLLHCLHACVHQQRQRLMLVLCNGVNA